MRKLDQLKRGWSFFVKSGGDKNNKVYRDTQWAIQRIDSLENALKDIINSFSYETSRVIAERALEQGDREMDEKTPEEIRKEAQEQLKKEQDAPTVAQEVKPEEAKPEEPVKKPNESKPEETEDKPQE